MDTWTIEDSNKDRLPAILIFEAYINDVSAADLYMLHGLDLFNPTAQIVYNAMLAMGED